MSEQVGITINKEHEITYTSKECSYIISKRDWDRLSRTINRLKHSSNKWANIAWGALSACVSFICSWLTCRDYMVLLVLGVVALAIAICFHDIPEGISMAVPMKNGGMKKVKVIFYVILSGITTGIGAFFGALVGTIGKEVIASATNVNANNATLTAVNIAINTIKLTVFSAITLATTYSASFCVPFIIFSASSNVDTESFSFPSYAQWFWESACFQSSFRERPLPAYRRQTRERSVRNGYRANRSRCPRRLGDSSSAGEAACVSASETLPAGVKSNGCI